MSIYNKVWAEPQNIGMMKLMTENLISGKAVRVTVQPGDVTAYHFFIAPIVMTYDYEISNDGRQPKGSNWPVNRPFGAAITILNEGFAERTGFAWFPAFQHLQESMGIRNPCTTEALVATLEAIWP